MTIIWTIVIAIAALLTGWCIGFECGAQWVWKVYRFGNRSEKPSKVDKAELIHKETITVVSDTTKTEG